MKEARRASTRSLLLSALVLSSSAFQAQAYYHPDEGRWLSRDPIGERGGRHLYGFIANNSIAFVDYLGLLVVYVGGAMEENQGQLSGFQKDAGADVAYGWNQGEQVLSKIKETIKANPCEPIIVIGHSWGGDTALDVADDLSDEKCLKCFYVVTLDPVSQLNPNAWFGGPNPGKHVTEWINIAQPAGLMDVIFDIPIVGWIAGGLWAGGSAAVGSNNGVATGGGQWNAEPQANVNIPAVGSDGKTLDHHDVAGMMNLTMPGKPMTVKQYIERLKGKDCCK